MFPRAQSIEECGALPVSAEDAQGIAEAAQRVKDGHASNEQLSRDLIEQARSESLGG